MHAHLGIIAPTYEPHMPRLRLVDLFSLICGLRKRNDPVVRAAFAGFLPEIRLKTATGRQN